MGIVGSYFGVIGHLPAFWSLPECDVVAISGTLPKPLKGIRQYKNWRTMLENEQLDAVSIAVPPKIQYEIAKFAIAKGLHVFAEKPFARNIKEAKALYTLAKKKGVIHGIDFEFPEIAEWKEVKKIIDAEIFGALKHISVDWDWFSGDIKYGKKTWKTDVSEGGGALAFYFSHGFHYLEHFAGKIKDVNSVFTYSPKSLNGGEVGASMVLTFLSGATGNARVSINSQGYIRHKLMFICEKGTIVLENKNAVVDNFSVQAYSVDGEHIIKVKKENGKKGEDERVKNIRKLADRFIKSCLARKGMTPSFADGLRVQELIEQSRKNTL